MYAIPNDAAKQLAAIFHHSKVSGTIWSLHLQAVAPDIWEHDEVLSEWPLTPSIYFISSAHFPSISV